MIPNIGMSELIVILAIALVLFGAKRVPEIARSIGQSLNSFKRGMKEGAEDEPEKKDEDKKS